MKIKNRIQKYYLRLGFIGINGKFGVMYRSKIIVLLTFVLLLSIAQSQSVFISNKSQLNNRKSQFHKPIGHVNNQLYTIDFGNYQLETGFTIEQYDEQLGYVKGKEIKTAAREWVLKVFSSDSGIYWISVIRGKRGMVDVMLNKQDLDLQDEVKSRSMGSFGWGEIGEKDLVCDYSLNREFWSIAILFNSGNRGFQPSPKIGILTGNISGRWVYQDTILPSKVSASELQWKAIEVNNSGEVLGVYYDENRLEKTSLFGGKTQGVSEAFLWVHSGNVSVKDKKNGVILSGSILAVENVRDVIAICHPQSQQFYFAGYFQASESRGLDGCFVQSFNKQKDSCNLIHWFNEVETKQLTGIIHPKRTDKPQYFEMRELIPLDNGGWVLVGEQYYITRQMETYYVNGVPQNTTRQFYHFGDIALSFLGLPSENKAFRYDSVVVIRKNQVTSSNNIYLFGYGIYVCGGALNFIFNDNELESNRIMHVKVGADFSVERGWLFKQENIIGEIIPEEGKQTEYCLFTVPLIRNKEWYWMQVLNDD